MPFQQRNILGSTFGTLEPPFAETAIICTQPSCAHRGRTKTHTKQTHTHTQHTKYKTIPHTPQKEPQQLILALKDRRRNHDPKATPRWPEVSGSSRSVPCPGAANQNRYTTRGGPVDGLWSQGERMSMSGDSVDDLGPRTHWSWVVHGQLDDDLQGAINRHPLDPLRVLYLILHIYFLI